MLFENLKLSNAKPKCKRKVEKERTIALGL
jgi:hypothetical protein